MGKDNDSIKQLLDAENKATDQVQEARKKKAARIKQARDEAYHEVAQEQAKCDAELKAEMSKSGTTSEKSTRLAVDTENQLKEIRRSAEANRVNVVRQVLAWVSTVDTTVPKH